jgi:hypothetical protein
MEVSLAERTAPEIGALSLGAPTGLCAEKFAIPVRK